MAVFWPECIANLNSELERTCVTVKHSSLPRSGSTAHRALLPTWSRRQLGAGHVDDVVRAGDGRFAPLPRAVDRRPLATEHDHRRRAARRLRTTTPSPCLCVSRLIWTVRARSSGLQGHTVHPRSAFRLPSTPCLWPRRRFRGVRVPCLTGAPPRRPASLG